MQSPGWSWNTAQALPFPLGLQAVMGSSESQKRARPKGS